MWHKLCSRPHLTGVELSHDPATGRVYVGLRQTTPTSQQSEGQGTEGGVALEEEEVEIDLDNSLSLEFSDEEIEYLSDDDVGEEERDGSEQDREMEEGEASAMASEIQLLKVCDRIVVVLCCLALSPCGIK